MLNMIFSLASLSQTLRTSHSKPTAADSSTHTPQSSPSASTASLSEQGQAMLAQDTAKAITPSATSAEWPVEMYQIPPWLASVLPMSGGELPKLLNGFGDSHVAVNKNFLSDGKDQEQVNYAKHFQCSLGKYLARTQY